MRSKTKIFIGSLLLLLGVTILLNNIGLLLPYFISANRLWDFFWPVLFLGIGVTLIFDKNFTLGVIFSVIGLAIFSSRLLSWSFWSTFWPLILIFIGFSILLRKEKKVSINDAASVSEEGSIDDTVLFWSVDKKVISKNFKGGDINTVFGGYKLDLREAKISKDDAVINVNCAFGGVEILVPNNCRVVTNGTAILGGWTPNIPATDTEKPVLTIRGVAAFGGVEIKS
jgi:predicted membrane protein